MLFGVSYSFWKAEDIGNDPAKHLLFLPLLIKLSGVIFLGLGDALAAIIGKKYGRFALPISGKTIEGFFACYLSMAIPFVYIIYAIGVGEEHHFMIKLNVIKNIFMILALGSFMETFTLQMDNLIVPYVLYMSLGHMDLIAFNQHNMHMLFQ